MINSAITTSSMNNVKARVELYNGSTLVQICTCSDYLQNFTVDRMGENNKFFGFGICHKLKVNFIDLEKTLTITKGYAVKIGFSIDNGKTFYYPYPKFFVTEIKRDDTAGVIEIEAYDALNAAAEHSVSEITLAVHTPADYLIGIIDMLGISSTVTKGGISISSAAFTTDYTETINFDGSESLREVLNRIAEVTQTIYYVDRLNRLVMCKLNNALAYSLRINKEDYFGLTTSAVRKLTTICHATELGENVEATQATKDATQYIRENEFWALREDIGTLLENALTVVGGVTIAPFVCEWAGNFALEPCDKIIMIADDNSAVTSYVLNDTIVYDGTLMETTQWSYSDDDAESFANPSTLGEVINQTYARVDKANKQIELLASEVSENSSSIATLQINTDSISGSVTSLKTDTEKSLGELNEKYKEVKNTAEMKLDAEQFSLKFIEELSNSTIDKVTTTTGFTFNNDGLTVSKSDSEISTTITEDGMRITKNYEEVLKADNGGVTAADLHATTYLIIGDKSRLQNFGGRTACFWIGHKEV